MAFILKKSNNNQKGIIIFTHKEYNYFTGRDLKIVNYLFQPHKFLLHFFDKFYNQNSILRLIKDLKENYLIGVHWGFFHKNVISEQWVDFHLAAKGTVNFPDNIFVIPLSSANFVNSSFYFDKNAEKYWDLVCVSRAAKFKKLDKLLIAIRKLYNDGYKVKICLIVPTDKNETKRKYYKNLIKDYESLFNYDERQNFHLIKLDASLGPLGVSSDFIAYVYRHSKIFTLFSEFEGESRVIKEAQKSGMLVVVNKNLVGGGRDFLNEENSVQFENYENAHLSIIQSLALVDDYQDNFSNDTFYEIEEKASIEKLKNSFNKLYHINNQVFDGILYNDDNLARRLPAHFIDYNYTWMKLKDWKKGWSDISSFKMFKRFAIFVKNQSN